MSCRSVAIYNDFVLNKETIIMAANMIIYVTSINRKKFCPDPVWKLVSTRLRCGTLPEQATAATVSALSCILASSCGSAAPSPCAAAG